MGTALPLLGFSFPAEYSSEYDDALNGYTLNGMPNASLNALAATNATSIQTILAYGIDPTTGTIYADTPGSTYNSDPTQAATAPLADEVAQIKAAVADGLSVMVRPTIDFLGDDAQTTYTTDNVGNQFFVGTAAPGGGDYEVGEFRADYLPTAATVNNFFASYKVMLDNEAQVALEGGAQYLCIGTELNPDLTSATYEGQWDDIIASVRQIDPTLKLTYSAPADYYNQATGQTVNPSLSVSFADKLDYIGVDDYLPLVETSQIGTDPTEADLVKAWETAPQPGTSEYDTIGNQSPLAYLEAMSESTGKPLLLTEIGYQNDTGAAASPDGESGYFQGVPDPTLQADLYQAFFQAVGQQGFSGIAGAYFWNWDPLENDGNADQFSPENNPDALSAATSGFADASAPDFIDLTNTSPGSPAVQTTPITGDTEVVIQGDPADGTEGAVDLNGANSYSGGTLIVDGLVTLGSATALGTGSLFVSTGTTLDLNGYQVKTPSLYGGGDIVAGQPGSQTAGPIPLTVSSGYFSGAFVDGPGNALVLDKSGPGTLTLTGASTFSGGALIEGGSLELAAQGAAGTGAITFAASAAAAQTLVLDAGATPGNGSTFENTISGFGDYDAIDIQGLALTTDAAVSLSPDHATLTVSSNGETVTFAMSNAQASAYYAHDDGTGHVLIEDSPPCYVTGTRIRTTRGDVAVEDLAIGDMAITAFGERRPIVWIGHRSLDLLRHAKPQTVMPVQIVAGAFGDNVPERDLWLSPKHAVFVAGALIPVERLINGSTIGQVTRSSVTYWHVELENHDVLLAEGLPAESYLESGNRSAFAIGGTIVDLHPDFDSNHRADSCAPWKESGPEVATVKARIAVIAERLREASKSLAAA